MKKTVVFVLTFAVLGLFANTAKAATAGPATGSATAIIIGALTLTHNAAATLNFGTTVSGTAGTIVVSAKDGTSTSTGVTFNSGITTQDGFTVIGAAGQSFTVTLPSTVTVTSGANTMTVSALTSFCGVAATSSCVASVTGTNIGVGGTLTVPASQATGTYNGTYPLSITY